LRVEVLSDYAALSERAAGLVAELVRRQPDAVLGLPTGATPEGMYAALARSGVSFARARTFNLDEYLGLPPDHPQSYRTWIREHFLRFVDLPPEAAHVPDGAAADPDAECERYEAAIRRAGGLDLVILGLGVNGHIGFNEPGTPWDSRTHRVVLSEATRRHNARFFRSPEEVPREAITMGIATILEARRVLLLASGRRKAEIVRRVLTEPPSPAVPATALHSHPRVTVLLDRAAASRLTPGPTAGE
jgi:glucosamine-6-phosphate deaminase